MRYVEARVLFSFLADLVLALYASGVSDRKVAQIVGLLLGCRYSHETIGNMTELVQKEIEAFRKRPPPRRPFAIHQDALLLKLRRPCRGHWEQALYIALGLTEDGRRVLLRFWLSPTKGVFVLKGL